MHYKEKTVNILDVPVDAVDLDEIDTCIKKWIETGLQTYATVKCVHAR